MCLSYMSARPSAASSIFATERRNIATALAELMSTQDIAVPPTVVYGAALQQSFYFLSEIILVRLHF